MFYERFFRPLLFHLEPELAHNLALASLRVLGHMRPVASLMRGVLLRGLARPTTLLGLKFEHFLGLAAGFDKDAKALYGLYALGFAFVEVGTVTARPWPGNPRPRVFRLIPQRALINRMGLPSEGAEVVLKRMHEKPPFPVLVNVARTPDPDLDFASGVRDMCCAIEMLAPMADAVVLNLSCPNTRDGRAFQDPEALEVLLREVGVRGVCREKPLLLKIGPDLPHDILRELVFRALRAGVAGFIATNTTLSRVGLKHSPSDTWPEGGLSGPPLRDRAVGVVRFIRQIAGSEPVVIGCGGISSPEDVGLFLEAGANLVEAFTGFVYRGPLFCRKILRAS